MEDTITFENLEGVLKEYAQAVEELYKRKLGQDNRPTTRDTLRKTMTSRIEYNGREYEVILNLAKYWRYIETDTAPHWTPYNAILDWVKVKPVIPRDRKKFSKNEETMRKQLTYLIRRKIAVFGTTGTPNLTNSVEEVNAIFKERIAEALKSDLSGYIRKVIG